MDYRIITVLLFEAALAFYLLRRSDSFSSVRGGAVCAVLLVLAFTARLSVFDHITTDYTWFLKVWVDFFRQNGGFRALRNSIGNYNIPYLYFLAFFSYLPIDDMLLIKALSTLADVFLAWTAMLLSRRCGAGRRASVVCFFLILFLPTVVINGAMWAQCDSIYVSLALLGILLALDGRPVASIAAIAFSFGFKLQAVFIMPVWLVIWIWKKYKWYYFLVFPLAYFLLILPAVIAGHPIGEAITLYFDQMDTVGPAMNYNSPSLTALLRGVTDANKDAVSTALIVSAFAAMAAVLVFAILCGCRMTNQLFICFTALTVMVIPFLLPHMHDRYFYAADIITVVIACCAPQCFPAAVFCQFGSLICYLAYMKTYYLRLGSIYLTNDRGAVAMLLAMIVVILRIAWIISVEKRKDSADIAPED